MGEGRQNQHASPVSRCWLNGGTNEYNIAYHCRRRRWSRRRRCIINHYPLLPIDWGKLKPVRCLPSPSFASYSSAYFTQRYPASPSPAWVSVHIISQHLHHMSLVTLASISFSCSGCHHVANPCLGTHVLLARINVCVEGSRKACVSIGKSG